MQSKIGFGTAAIGRPQYINIRKEGSTDFELETFRQDGMKMLDEAYHLGIRYFDTAPGYGLAERLLIDWSKTHHDIEIATKWGYTYVADFNTNARVHEVKEHSLAKLNEQWNQSKLLLPGLTTYQIHSATFESGVLENDVVLNRMAAMKAEHRLRIGLTTTGANQLEVLKQALEVAVNGELLFDAFQVTYNIFDQSIAAVASLFEDQDRRLIIKEALANGRTFPNERYPQYASAYEQLQHLANAYQVGLDAIALRFCMDSIPAFKVLSGATIPQHLSDNLKAEHIELSQADIQILKELAISPEAYWSERKQLVWN
ncbi:MAG: aldo/keto reductase [Bacteroidia bacterium]|nr:aldo/keto reductase [Bacteroidia bacterium]